jgi:hypothetical protein
MKPKWWQLVLYYCVWAILLTILVPVMVIYVPYHFYVVRPIIYAVLMQPLYWLNWQEVKRKSNRKTSQVLSTLHMYSGPDILFECQLRSEEDVLRLERLLKRKRPKKPYPLSRHQAIFFVYRRKGGGGGRSVNKPGWFEMLIPVRVHA